MYLIQLIIKFLLFYRVFKRRLYVHVLPPCTLHVRLFINHISNLKLKANPFFFFFHIAIPIKMKDRIAGPRSVPTGSVRSSYSPSSILSLRTRFPSPPPSCPPLPTTCGFYSMSFARATNKRLVEVNVKAHSGQVVFFDDVVVAAARV